nr:unnamed protein product [Digitaria exilis]
MVFLGHIQQERKKCYELVRGDVKKKAMIDFIIVESALTILVKGQADFGITQLLEFRRQIPWETGRQESDGDDGSKVERDGAGEVLAELESWMESGRERVGWMSSVQGPGRPPESTRWRRIPGGRAPREVGVGGGCVGNGREPEMEEVQAARVEPLDDRAYLTFTFYITSTVTSTVLLRCYGW